MVGIATGYSVWSKVKRVAEATDSIFVPLSAEFTFKL